MSMSFSYTVKKELCKIMVDDLPVRKAESYGMLLFSRSFSAGSIAFSTENENTARHWGELIASLTGVDVDIQASSPGKKSGNRFFMLSISHEDQRRRVLTFFGHNHGELNLRIQGGNIKNDACIGAFLRGVFLVCGSVADPEKEYHLELDIAHKRLAEDMRSLLASIGLQVKMIARKGNYVLYFKESEFIEDFLTHTGATNASLDIMNIKIYKDLRNRANRVTNCETANIDKTVAAASQQTKDIRFIIDKKGTGFLPEDLRELALIRLENPDMSLRELCRLLPDELSRSGVNHRLKRIAKLAQELRMNEK